MAGKQAEFVQEAARGCGVMSWKVEQSCSGEAGAPEEGGPGSAHTQDRVTCSIRYIGTLWGRLQSCSESRQA